MIKYLNNKGSALILVLSSLIILFAISSVAIALSIANMTMSRKYSDWSKEYYRLDHTVEQRIGELDRSALITSVNVSGFYLQNEYFQYASINDFPTSADCMPSNVRIAFLSFPELQIMLYGRWTEIMSILDFEYEYGDETGPPPFDELQLQYETAMEDFLPKAFNVVYCACLNANLSNISSASNIINLPGIDSTVNINNTCWFPTINPSDTFDSLYNKIGEIPKIRVLAWENSTSESKQIEAELEIIAPSLDVVYQTRYYSINPNPTATEVQGKFSCEDSCAATRFFSTGAYSADALGIEYCTTISTTAGERKNEDIPRYIINSWRQKST